MTTEILAQQHWSVRRSNPTSLVHRSIRGRDIDNPYPDKGHGFDITGSVYLYTDDRHDGPNISLAAYNFADSATIWLKRNGNQTEVPSVKIALDGQLQPLSEEENPMWMIHEGQIFQAWMGDSDAFEERDERYGYATITWIQPHPPHGE